MSPRQTCHSTHEDQTIVTAAVSSSPRFHVPGFSYPWSAWPRDSQWEVPEINSGKFSIAHSPGQQDDSLGRGTVPALSARGVSSRLGHQLSPGTGERPRSHNLHYRAPFYYWLVLFVSCVPSHRRVHGMTHVSEVWSFPRLRAPTAGLGIDPHS